MQRCCYRYQSYLARVTASFVEQTLTRNYRPDISISVRFYAYVLSPTRSGGPDSRFRKPLTCCYLSSNLSLGDVYRPRHTVEEASY